jgi:methionyl-tRNA formyltransferase
MDKINTQHQDNLKDKVLRVVFMGTPEFATLILKEIHQSAHQVVGVVTVPDKPTGRGLKITESSVKTYAVTHQIPVLQPTSLKSDTFLQELEAFQADVFVVVAFRMLPKAVWSMPSLGTFNLHASLLPHYRGAAPIQWAIANGETETGVTTFLIDDKIDTGAVLLQQKIVIDERETGGSLHDKLAEIGKVVVLETLKGLSTSSVKPLPQPMDYVFKEAPKIHRDNCKINWNTSVLEIDRLVRAMNPFPTAYTILKTQKEDLMVKLYDVFPCVATTNVPAGNIEVSSKGFKVAAADGWIEIIECQFPNKKRMTAQALLNGFKFTEEDRFL